MKNDPGMDLIRLFADVDEPGQGDVFAARVAGRMRSARYVRRATQVILAGMGAAVLVLLTPWVIGLTGYVTRGSTALANGSIDMVFLPVVFVMGGAAGLFAFLRGRL